MKYLLPIALLYSMFSFQNCSAQTCTCDTSVAYHLLKKQLRIADKDFKFNGKYYVDAKDTLSIHGKIYNADHCPQLMRWNSSKTTSGLAIFSDTAKHDMTCFVSKPYFNAKGNKCMVVMYVHMGEWGGGASAYIYRRVLGGWWLVHTHLRTVN